MKIEFRTIKEYVQVPQAAAFYGMEITRSNMTNCPFHGDRTPSMKPNEKFYYCFGCQASGDVIDPTAQLLGVNLCQAAVRLMNDFHLQGRPVVLQSPQAIAQRNQRNELADETEFLRKNGASSQRLSCQLHKAMGKPLTHTPQES